MRGVLTFFPAGSENPTREQTPLLAADILKLAVQGRDKLLANGCYSVSLMTAAHHLPFNGADTFMRLLEREGIPCSLLATPEPPFPAFSTEAVATLNNMTGGDTEALIMLLDIQNKHITIEDLRIAIEKRNKNPQFPVISYAPIRDNPIQLYTTHSIVDIGTIHFIESQTHDISIMLPNHVITRPFTADWNFFDEFNLAIRDDTHTRNKLSFWSQQFTSGRTVITPLPHDQATTEDSFLIYEASGLTRLCLRRDGAWMRALTKAVDISCIAGVGTVRRGPGVLLTEEDKGYCLRSTANFSPTARMTAASFGDLTLGHMVATPLPHGLGFTLTPPKAESWGVIYAVLDTLHDRGCSIETNILPRNGLWALDRKNNDIVLKNGELFHGRQQNPDIFIFTDSVVLTSTAELQRLVPLMESGRCSGILLQQADVSASCYETIPDISIKWWEPQMHALPCLLPRFEIASNTFPALPAGVADLHTVASLLDQTTAFARDEVSQNILQDFNFFLTQVTAFVTPTACNLEPEHIAHTLASWELAVEISPRSPLFEEIFLELDARGLLQPENLPAIIRATAAISLSNKFMGEKARQLLHGLRIQNVRPYSLKRQLLSYLPTLGETGATLLQEATSPSFQSAIPHNLRLDWNIKLSGLMSEPCPKPVMDKLSLEIPLLKTRRREDRIIASTPAFATLLTREGYMRRAGAVIWKALVGETMPPSLAGLPCREANAITALDSMHILGGVFSQPLLSGLLEERLTAAAADGLQGLNQFRDIFQLLVLLGRMLPAELWRNSLSAIRPVFQHSELHLREARVLFHQTGHFDEELWCLERLPSIIDIDLCAKITSLLRLGRMHEALELIPQTPWKDGALHAILLRNQGRYSESLNMLQRLCAAPSAHYSTRIQLAVTLAFMGRRSESRTELEATRKDRPFTSSDAYGWLMVHGDAPPQVVLDTCTMLGTHTNGTLPFQLAALHRVHGPEAACSFAEEHLMHKAAFSLAPKLRESLFKAFASGTPLHDPRLARSYVTHLFGDTKQSTQLRFYIKKLCKPDTDPVEFLPLLALSV